MAGAEENAIGRRGDQSMPKNVSLSRGAGSLAARERALNVLLMTIREASRLVAQGSLIRRNTRINCVARIQ